MGRWGVLDVSQKPIIKSIITHFLSINYRDYLFYGDTVRDSKKRLELEKTTLNLELFVLGFYIMGVAEVKHESLFYINHLY